MPLSRVGRSCFLCLSELPKLNRSGRKKVQSALTFKYLLQTEDNRHDHILQAVSQSLSSSSVQFCGSCEASLSKVSDLHLELEVLQMKLIHVLKSVKEIVIKADSTKLDADVNGKRTQCADQKSFEALVSFQNAVTEGNKNKSVHIPFVLLERYTNFKHPPSHSPDIAPYVQNPAVKTESSQDEGVIFPFDDFDDCLSPPEVEEPEKKVDIRCGRDLVNPGISAKASKSKIPVTRRKRRRRLTPKPRKPSKVAKAEMSTKIKKAHLYNCDICGYQIIARHAFRFEHHLRNHEAPEKIYKCEKCPTHAGFSGKQYHKYHLDFHNNLNGIRCDVCGRKLDPTLLPEHLLTHAGVDKIFQCHSCSYSAASEQKYLEHTQRNHPGVNLVCHICSEKFSTQRKFMSHMHHAHQKLEKRVCGVKGCGKEFFTSQALMVHNNVAHSGKTCICHECGKAFTTATNLKVHQAKHTGTKFCVCDYPGCPESFSSNDGLFTHKIKEHGDPKLKCEYCDKEYFNRESLKQHMASQHEGKLYSCEYCSKIMNHKKQWQRHMMTHTAPEKLTCKECGRSFNFTKGLQNHMLIHHGGLRDRKFKCTYCSKAFLVKGHLQQHLQLHAGEKTWMCHQCGKAFSQHAGLYLHKKNQHKDTNAALPTISKN